MSEENVEVVQLVVTGFRAGVAADEVGTAFDLGVEAGLVAADAELIPARELAGDATYRGKSGFVEFMRIWTEDFEDWSIRVERAVEIDGGVVVAHLRQSGMGKRSGVPVDLVHGAVFELQNGRIIRIRLYLDPREAEEAAGLSG